jgi:hypothetical protein
MNMWSKLYILILQFLSNFACVWKVWVNNEHPVQSEAPERLFVFLEFEQSIAKNIFNASGNDVQLFC